MKFSKLYCLLGDEHKTLMVLSLLILFLPISESSLFKWPISNSALCIISLLSLIKFKNSSPISSNFYCLDKNSSVYPCTLKAFSETFLSGFK